MTHEELQFEIGKRLRCRRRLLDLTQKQLADACGITFQQIQKYEDAVCSVSAARLWELAQVLNVSMGYFFEGFGEMPSAARVPMQKDFR